jgi:hypothetical protein
VIGEQLHQEFPLTLSYFSFRSWVIIDGILWVGPHLDKLAHQVIPRHPELRPHVRMLHHFRFIIPLLSQDGDGFTPLHYYDSGIQLARNTGDEPTNAEYVQCLRAASEIKKM